MITYGYKSIMLESDVWYNNNTLTYQQQSLDSLAPVL